MARSWTQIAPEHKIDAPAFDPMTLDPRKLAGLGRFGKRLLGRGEKWAALALKMSTMSAVDFLSEWFESERLIAPMAVSGIIGFVGLLVPHMMRGVTGPDNRQMTMAEVALFALYEAKIQPMATASHMSNESPPPLAADPTEQPGTLVQWTG